MNVSLCAGPGGLDQGERILNPGGRPADGFDIDEFACATASAAGFTRTRADIRDLDPADFDGYTTATVTTPCPSFSAAGKGDGRAALPLLHQALDAMAAEIEGDLPAGAYRRVLDQIPNPAAALVTTPLQWATGMRDVTLLVAEQVPAVAPIWEHTAAILTDRADWAHCAVITLAAEDVGSASRRSRAFLIASKERIPDYAGLPHRGLTVFEPGHVERHPASAFGRIPGPTMAQTLGWPEGERVNTRGNRRTSGGNEFSADGPSYCLTSKARGWYRVSDKLRLTDAEAGLLMGFPLDYPWRGARSRRFGQSADAVCPLVGAAVMGAATAVDWRPRLLAYLDGLHPAVRPGGVSMWAA